MKGQTTTKQERQSQKPNKQRPEAPQKTRKIIAMHLTIFCWSNQGRKVTKIKKEGQDDSANEELGEDSAQQEDSEVSADKEDLGEFVIDRIISHGINEDSKHPTAKVGETTYRVRWFGYEASDDTYEPIRHLPRNKVVSYYNKKKLTLPKTLGQAQLG